MNVYGGCYFPWLLFVAALLMLVFVSVMFDVLGCVHV